MQANTNELHNQAEPAQTSNNDAASLPAVLTVEETARFLRIGRSVAYELVRTGVIPSIRLGKLIRIPRDTLLNWLATEGFAGTKE